MTVSMRKIQAGRGYDYLLKSVVRGDANMADPNPVTRYYTEEGTPPRDSSSLRTRSTVTTN